jgi:creatinine amidohydrolase
VTKFRLDEMTGHEYATSKFDKAILAVGSCENHGQHLPHGTDTLVSYRLSLAIAEKVEGLLVLPPVTFGMSAHYADFPLTISLQPETLIHMLKDILESLYRQDIKHIIIFNGHDGNIAPIEIAARDVKVAHPDVKIASLADWWVIGGQLLPPDTFEVWNGLGHAGEGETSIALALFPEMVEMDQAKGIVPELPAVVEMKWKFSELTNVGATGGPEKANVKKGEAMRDVLVDAMVKTIKQLDATNWEYGMKK